jgi:hypothetical protein
MEELDLNSMESCVRFNLRWLSWALAQFFVVQLGQRGLLPTQTPILGLLATKPESTIRKVIKTIGKERWSEILRDLDRAALALN